MADSKRKAVMREEAREVMREKMSFAKTLGAIEDAENALLEMAQNEENPNNGKIGALRTLLDSKWKRMDRLLPALKSVDANITGDIKAEVNGKIEVSHV